MNLIEIAEDLKNVPDQYLMQEVQQPTGNFPAYLVVSELGRRKRMREKVAKDMPTQTVAEELATPPQPQMPQMGTMMPQGAPQAGLMAMPQAQTELAAQDAMGTTPPEMMMPQQMAGGGMVSFRQGGDVIRAFDGLPEEFFTTGVNQPSISRGELTELMTLPELQQYNRTGVVPERLRSRIGTSLIERGSFIGGLPLTTGPAQFPSAVTPAAVTTPTTAPAAAPTIPAGTPPAAPPVARATIPVQPAPSVPEALTPYALATIGAQAASDYEQAVPDRTTKFLTEDIARREADIEKRRSTNISDALIQAGLGAMRAKPKFGGTAGLFEVIGEGGQAGFDVLRQGRKDIMQSEEAINAARAKMIEAEMLRDDRKFKAASDARKEAIDLNNYGLNLAKTDSAIALQNVNAQRIAQMIPYEIAESQARAAAYGLRGIPKPMTAEERMLLEPQAVARLKRRGISSPTDAQIDAEIAALRGMSSAEPATALDRGILDNT
jgi:hypothetical protein